MVMAVSWQKQCVVDAKVIECVWSTLSTRGEKLCGTVRVPAQVFDENDQGIEEEERAMAGERLSVPQAYLLAGNGEHAMRQKVSSRYMADPLVHSPSSKRY